MKLCLADASQNIPVYGYSSHIDLALKSHNTGFIVIVMMVHVSVKRSILGKIGLQTRIKKVCLDQQDE